jgi:hypothetical protein
MTNYRYSIECSDSVAQTLGLHHNNHPELRIDAGDPRLLSEARAFLQFVVRYMEQTDARIKPGETLTYGYWLTKFERARDDYLEVWEYNANATKFIDGGALALTYWRDQHDFCVEVGAQFAPPRADKKAAISAGVYEGEPVEAVRYPSPEHMSGWWLTTDRYNGDIKSLQVVHLYHVSAARPELVRYLALPYGWRFASGGQAWFDERVGNEPA